MHNQINEIPVQAFSINPFYSWDNNWFVLSCGDFKNGQYNAMTVAWGGFGNMWSLPMALAVVRPSRYTFQFLNQFDTFTLCAFPESFKDALNLIGTKSGRDGDKIKESGLTPIAAKIADAPVYEQAELMVECKKMYWDDFKPEHFLHPEIEKHYPNGDFHRMVIGQILFISGDQSKYAS